MRKIEGIIIVIGIIISAIFVTITLTSPNSIVHSFLITHKITIVDSSIVVPPSQYVSYTINSIPNSKNCKIHGTFSAQGGNNDIKVSVFSQSNLINLQGEKNLITYFSTPQQISGDIFANVPCDQTIYLVYDNSFSIITSKTVTTKVEYEYNQ